MKKIKQLSSGNIQFLDEGEFNKWVAYYHKEDKDSWSEGE